MKNVTILEKNSSKEEINYTLRGEKINIGLEKDQGSSMHCIIYQST